MFTSSLRRQSPTILRLAFSSARALTFSQPSSSSITRSVPLKSAVLSSSPAQRRFFAISSYLRDEANAASQEAFLDLDPPAGEYAHSGHGEEHHFGKNEPITTFQQLADKGLVDKTIINTITKDMGYEEMTKVQRKTILETIKGDNVLAQAKTGTGKTIAFLLPVLQRLLKAQKPLSIPTRASFKSRGRGRDFGSNADIKSNADIRAIIVSPTRELATQIAVDAKKLTKGTPLIVQTAVGGSGKRESLQEIHQRGCHILVATPGRLLDLLTDPAGVKAPDLEIFVMDEADNLLDVGFAKELDDIMAALPPRDKAIGDTGKGRQTLLFSATVPDKVMGVVKTTMGKDYKFLRMVEKGEAQTHERVEQRLIRCTGLENTVPALYELCQREIALHQEALVSGSEEALPFKAIVFFSATRWASLAAETFRNLRGDGNDHPLRPTKIFEIHSRLTQGARDNAAARFRGADSAILFSSDVTARGMDFPKVTHVIQIGSPRNQEQYIHRLGRTARGTREGVGYLILPDVEFPYTMRELNGMPFIEDKSLKTARLDLSAEQNLPKSTADMLTAITEAAMRVPRELKSRTYSALLGLYTMISDKARMVSSLNSLATLGWGLETTPYVSPMLARKMGLDRVPGLNSIRGPEDEYFNDEDSGSSFSRGGGSSRGGFGGGRGGGGFGASRGRAYPPRPWEGRGSQGRSFSSGEDSSNDRGGRGGRGGFGGSSRGGFSPRNSEFSREGGFSRDSDRGGRSSYGSRDNDSDRSERSSYGSRDSDSSGRGGRSSYGSRDGEFSGGRGGFSSRGRGGDSYTRGGGRGGFSSRGRDNDFGGRGGGFGGRSSYGSRDSEYSRPSYESGGRGGFGGRGRGGDSYGSRGRGGFSSRGRDGDSGRGGRSYGDRDGGSFSGRGGGGFGGRGRDVGDNISISDRPAFKPRGDRDGESGGFGGRASRARSEGGSGMSRFESEED